MLLLRTIPITLKKETLEKRDSPRFSQGPHSKVDSLGNDIIHPPLGLMKVIGNFIIIYSHT